jgi:cell division initiation protein
MKITPIDIQQMVFQVKFRGYDRDEVNRFLEELALTVENLNRENSALREKLTATEQQVTDCDARRRRCRIPWSQPRRWPRM